MSFLDAVRLEKEAEVQQLLADPPRLPNARRIRSLSSALLAPGLQVLAEIKRASPTRGPIRPGSDPIEIAKQYESAGAAGISMLTDRPHFGGSIQELQSIRDSVGIPVLRKDFLIHPIQVDEAYLAGADAVLLIVAMLGQDELKALLNRTRELGMEALIEVHDSEELAAAIAVGGQLIGINSRNLKTLEIDLKTTETLLPQCPPDCVRVAESGIFTAEDARRMAKSGADAVLVGSSLMLADHPGRALEALRCG